LNGSAWASEAEPAAFLPAGQVRPIDAPTGSAFENTADTGTLRWRVKQPKTSGEGVKFVSRENPLPVGEGGRGTRPGEGVHLSKAVTTQTQPGRHPGTLARGEEASTTTHRVTFAERAHASSRVASAAAFEDPFNDRKFAVAQAQALEPAEEEAPMGLNAAITTQQPAEEEAQPPMSRFQPPARRQPRPMDRPAPEPEPAPEPMHEPSLRYNGRNCEEEGGQCADQRIRIKSDLLRDKNSIIDITPPLALSNDLKEKIVRSHQDLKRIPGRKWRDRQNNIVVEHGKLIGVAYRHAVILDASNKEVRIPLNQLGDDEQCFLAAWWNVPTECVLGDERHPGRDFVPATMTWTASALCSKPNYFEEVQLERYGHTAGIFQPAISGAHFFINIAVLPYKAGINPPNECRYALGYYRPGSCAPWMIPPVPLSIRGAATQAAAVGIIAPLIP
jgi:hypothetical protein